MSTLDNAIRSINTAADRTTKTTEFVDQLSTYDDISDVTNPNTGETVPSLQKKTRLVAEAAFAESETQINQAVSDAELAALAARSAANYDTEFVAGVTSAIKGKSYLYSGSMWACLNDTSSTPSEGNANWYSLNNHSSLTDRDKQGAHPASAIDGVIEVLDTVADMKAATWLQAGQLVETKGYHSAGDGGQARYLIQTSAEFGGTPDEYGSHTLVNGYVAVLQVEGAVNVKQFGAVGGGVFDCYGPISASLRHIESTGGGVVKVGAGVYRISKGLLSTSPETIGIKGESPDLTRFKLDDGAVGAVISISNKNGGFVENITLESNGETNPAGGHGLRLSNIDGFYVYGLTTKDTNAYGIALQGNFAFKNITMRKIRIYRAGSDGIDVKNRINQNENNLIDDLIVSEFGLTDTGSKAGVDLRGPWILNNVRVVDFGGGPGVYDGVRLRPGESDSDGGQGGHKSQLTNILVDAKSISPGTSGINIESRQVQVTNFHVERVSVGVWVRQEDCNLSAGVIRRVGTGICFVDQGYTSPGRRCAVTSLKVRDIDGACVIFAGSQNSITGLTARNGIVGVSVESGANQNSIIGGSITNMSGQILEDNGDGTRLIAVAGVADK